MWKNSIRQSELRMETHITILLVPNYVEEFLAFTTCWIHLRNCTFFQIYYLRNPRNSPFVNVLASYNRPHFSYFLWRIFASLLLSADFVSVKHMSSHFHILTPNIQWFRRAFWWGNKKYLYAEMSSCNQMAKKQNKTKTRKTYVPTLYNHQWIALTVSSSYQTDSQEHCISKNAFLFVQNST